jgi:hypothetical protein
MELSFQFNKESVPLEINCGFEHEVFTKATVDVGFCSQDMWAQKIPVVKLQSHTEVE